ncbi:MAG: hypothetical protein EZS28_047230, partial [Streblomastix strix]
MLQSYEKLTDPNCKPNILENVDHFSKIILILLAYLSMHEVMGNSTSYTNDNNIYFEINIYSDKISATSRYAQQIASRLAVYYTTKDM